MRPLGIIARWAAPTLGFVLIGLSIFVLRRQLQNTSYAEIIGQVQATPAGAIALAMLLAASAYGVLVGYDYLALTYIGRSLPLRRIAMGSFVAHSMSHSLGFHVITSGSVRFRFWSAWGLSNAEIAAALGFASASFLLGMILVCGLVLMFEPPQSMALLHLPAGPMRVLGVLLAGGVVSFLVWLRRAGKEVRVFGFQFRVPRTRLAIAHLSIAASDWILAASVTYVLLPAGHGVGLLPFTGMFLFALLAGAVGHVPGGVGVLELLMVRMLSPYISAPGVMGALIMYRLIYYVVPFVIGLGMLLVHELRREGARVAQAATAAARWVPSVMPFALSIAVFSAGTVVLLSGAVALNMSRMEATGSVLPLAVIELAHFASCILGAALLVYSWFIQRRLSRAHSVVVVTLVLATVAAMLRGLVWEVAGLLAAVLALLMVSRQIFRRREPLSAVRMPVTWVTGVVTVVALSVWLGFFSFKDVDYSSAIWWTATLGGDAARFARGMAGAVLFLLYSGISRLVRRRG